MKVENISIEYIRPSIPTPLKCRSKKISAIDELAPTLNVPLILYYTSVPGLKVDGLKSSLSQTLSQFYPLAGRYNRKLHSIDCNDKGVKYVSARLSSQLVDFLGDGKRNPELLNCLLPCEIGEVDEVIDPLLAVQVTMFECGGVSLGVLMSHRVGDATTISSFVNEWAVASKEGKVYSTIFSSFSSAMFFPGENFPRTDVGIPRATSSNLQALENRTKVFSFGSKAISLLRDNLRSQPKVSRVQLVFALIWSALMDVDEAKKGKPRTSYVFQLVNLRERTIPLIPKNTCGNLWTLANAKREVDERNIELNVLVERLCSAVKETIDDCGKVHCVSDKGQAMVTSKLLHMTKLVRDSEVSSYWLSSWSKIRFYEADFGWGTPEWVSSASFGSKNVVFLMDQKDGEGIEAWIHIDQEEMINFQNHVCITTYAH